MEKKFKSDFAFVHLCFPYLPDFYYYYIYKIYKTRQWNFLLNQQETIKQSKKPQPPFIEHFNFPLSLAWTDRKALHLWMCLIYQEWEAVPVNGVQDWGGPGERDEVGGEGREHPLQDADVWTVSDWKAKKKMPKIQ